MARLEWEEHLSYFGKKTEEEIERLRDEIWYGSIEQKQGENDNG